MLLKRFSKGTLFAILLYTLTGCTISETSAVQNWRENRKEFEKTADDFFAEENFHALSVTENGSAWHMVNAWSFRPGYDSLWSGWDAGKKSQVFLGSLEDVLRRERITDQQYNRYKAFLLRHKLTSIAKYSHAVEIEYIGRGFHYLKNEAPALAEDHEYLYVRQLAPKWFYFTRDWN